MRSFLFTGIAASAMVFFLGCGDSMEPAPMEVTEDEIAAYEAMIAADQEQTEADESDEASQQ